MSQLTLAALIGIAGWLAWKNFGPQRRRPARVPERPSATPLELDPETGLYRPKQPDKR